MSTSTRWTKQEKINIALSIKKRRLEHGWSQSEFGQRINRSQQCVAHLESGRYGPHPRTLKLISSVLACEIKELYQEEA